MVRTHSTLFFSYVNPFFDVFQIYFKKFERKRKKSRSEHFLPIGKSRCEAMRYYLSLCLCASLAAYADRDLNGLCLLILFIVKFS